MGQWPVKICYLKFPEKRQSQDRVIRYFPWSYVLIGPHARVRNVLDVRHGREGWRGTSRARTGASNGAVVLDEEEGRGLVLGWRRKSARRGRTGGVGEQYLGDFALYLEMSFVGSISSTIRTLSLCPGISGCWFCSCLSVSANRYTPYMSLSPSPPPRRSSVFSSSLSPALPTTLFVERASLPRSSLCHRTNVYVSVVPVDYVRIG